MSQKIMNKLKLWFKKTELTNVGYLITALVAILIGSKLLLGAALGIFVYINFNIIQKLIKGIIENYKNK